MRFERIRLENFKPYADADLRLDRGVSVIHGPNGSGKSSLLEACFFALYGSKALDDANLEDVMTEGTEAAEIELWFAHEGNDYRVHRRLRATGDRARTAKCVLETPEDTIEGATAVREAVAGMLRMDADAFVNCAYVRQGEVNKLIHASPGERQDMIDDLLQLGKLEEYRERASEARLGVKDVLSGQRDVAESLEEQIDEKESADLHERLNELESRRTDVLADIDDYEENLETARETRDEAVEVLERYEQKREQLGRLEGEIDDLRETIEATEREREELAEEARERRDRLAELREERSEVVSAADLEDTDPGTVESALASLRETDEDLRDRIEDLNLEVQDATGEAERLRERADELDAEADAKREEAADLEATVEDDEETLVERRQKLADLDDRIAELETRFEDAPVEFGESEAHLADLRERREDLAETVGDLEGDLQALTERIAEAEDLLAAGKCPECGQPVEDSPHVDRLDEDRERARELRETIEERQADLADIDDRIEAAEDLLEAERELHSKRENREDVGQLVAEKETAIAEDRERVADLREAADELEEEAEQLRETADEREREAEQLRGEIAEINAERTELRERIRRIERVAELNDGIDDLEDEVDTLEERRESKAELNDERRDRLAEKRDRRDELRETYDEDRVEEARAEKERAEQYIDRVTDRLADLREERDDLSGKIGAVENEIRELERLRDRLEEVADRREALEGLYEEAQRLQETYGDLRAELRRQNVETLERMLNETFDLVYENDSYARIELDADYELTVYQKDGEPLDPGQLSGGERALFNLSLRCAIYRLLAEGIDGAAPLPPLILDEPTVFLDSGHVSRLVELVDHMRDLGVEQIVVVTHDEELIGAADSVIRVEKNPTTNRSSVRRADRELLAD